MILEEIRKAIHENNYRVTDHADEEMGEDNLSLGDILESVVNGEIIENYPKDFPFPSCLILGKNRSGENIHSVWACDESKRMGILVTAYRPDSGKWIDARIRR